ncbi:MAG: 50S ribosomal protein L25/general stress protein Ctc [Betaproteobacteria bacterium]
MQFELNAQQRTLQGTSASRRLRRAGKVPGVVYGGGQAAEAIELDHNTLLLSLKKEAFHSSVLTLNLDGKKQQVLLRDTQVHAYKPLVLHIDFQRVDAKQEVHIKVPLHFINEDTAPGVKIGGGLVNHLMTELDISCLPANLPSFIEVDVGALNAGENIHASQLKLPKGVKAVLHAGDDPIVVGIVGKAGGDEDEAAAAPAEGEAPAA